MKSIGAVLFPIVMVAGLLISAFVIVTAVLSASNLAAPTGANGPVAPVSQQALAQQGRALFVAKGCMVCHQNNRAASVGENTMQFGDVPNLTNVKIEADYLRRWLRDPKAIKPSTQMPNLNLSEGEIEALVAFLKG